MNPEQPYQRDPDMLPDSRFEPGELSHLVVGNRGRLLDPRRTPVTLVEIKVPSGMMVMRIDGFEDEGALWEVPLENIHHYQFAQNQDLAPDRNVKEYQAAIDRLDRPLVVERDTGKTEATLTRLEESRTAARQWLRERSEFFASKALLPPPAERRGSPALWLDLRRYLEEHGLWRMEAEFSTRFVRNPYSGELVKGHRMVLAELGLVSFHDKQIRTPGLFEGEWSRERRARHILLRLGFVRGLFDLLGLETLDLYRGLSAEGPLLPPKNRTFVSATFDKAIAVSHFQAVEGDASRALYRHAVPIDRVFMTFYETEAMNQNYLEAEAVLLFQEGAPL